MCTALGRHVLGAREGRGGVGDARMTRQHVLMMEGGQSVSCPEGTFAPVLESKRTQAWKDLEEKHLR